MKVTVLLAYIVNFLKTKLDSCTLFKTKMYNFISSYQRRFIKRSLSRKVIVDLYNEKNILEIGGPSKIFNQTGMIPIYPNVASLDNCNFSEDTIWKHAIEQDQSCIGLRQVHFNRQYICEADLLHEIPSESYHTVISSHVLEHISDPISALIEWRRVLDKNGALILIVPEKSGTFDHKRPVTSFNHLKDDFQKKVGPEDMTHFEEILELHDIDKDAGINNYEALKQRGENNQKNRSLHHHVFDTKLVEIILNHCGYNILLLTFYRPCHIIAIAKKT